MIRPGVKQASLRAGFAFFLQACGGGMPILHPAQPLPSGVTSMSAGVGSHWVGGQAQRELDNAQSAWAASPGTERSLSPSAAVAAAVWAPGTFPWVSMRLGLGSQNEAGIAYTGQHARIDGRHALELGHWALSFGLGANMGLAHPSDASYGGSSTLGSSEVLPGLDTSGVRSFGVDVPILVGWRSSADVARIWMGLRPGYEHGYGSLRLTTQATLTNLDYQSDALTVTAVAGLAVGLRPLFLALEFGFADTRAHGKLLNNTSTTGANSASVAAYSFTPAAAIIWEMH